MANEEQCALLKQGAEVWNKWRFEHQFVAADLREAFLIGEQLSGVDLRRADLSGAELRSADLSEADLSGANLRGAELNIANLSDANLSGATLSDTSFYWAIVDGTTFSNLDLSTAHGLETITHYGPSTIGVDTLIRSGGKIPEAFLRGCGVPDSFIEYLPSLIGAMQPIQFYSCFISYSSENEVFAHRLQSRMRDNHLRVWFAPEDIKAGQKLYEQIDQAIRVHDKLVLVLSEESIHSEWVMTEIRRARKAELRDNRRKLFPIRLVSMESLRAWECFDADTGKDLATEVRDYFIPDFTHWKDHDAFERTFARLLNDLKTTDALPVPVVPALPAPQPPKQRVEASDIRELKQRRLHHLQRQRAIQGVNTPAGVLMEIEDLLKELA